MMACQVLRGLPGVHAILVGRVRPDLSANRLLAACCHCTMRCLQGWQGRQTLLREVTLDAELGTLRMDLIPESTSNA